MIDWIWMERLAVSFRQTYEDDEEVLLCSLQHKHWNIHTKCKILCIALTTIADTTVSPRDCMSDAFMVGIRR
jgi:hypothetical protein